MSNITDTERREIANFCRTLGNKELDFTYDNVVHAINADINQDAKCWFRLADLIEPKQSLMMSDVYKWAHDCVDAANEQERHVYIGICNLIGGYFHDCLTQTATEE